MDFEEHKRHVKYKLHRPRFELASLFYDDNSCTTSTLALYFQIYDDKTIEKSIFEKYLLKFLS